MADLVRLFALDSCAELSPKYNIAPSQPIGVIRTPGRLELLRWGLSLDHGPPKINVRSETVGHAPAYRDAFWNRRCLVIVDGFYEWQQPAFGKIKQPYLVRREDREPFALAGIWQDETCAVLTGAARGPVAELHDRAPIIVPRGDYKAWLDHSVRIDVSTDDDGLIVFPVSALVNSPANDGPECILPAEKRGVTLPLF